VARADTTWAGLFKPYVSPILPGISDSSASEQAKEF